jgi:hypothetical protein
MHKLSLILYLDYIGYLSGGKGLIALLIVGPEKDIPREYRNQGIAIPVFAWLSLFYQGQEVGGVVSGQKRSQGLFPAAFYMGDAPGCFRAQRNIQGVFRKGLIRILGKGNGHKYKLEVLWFGF